MENYLFLHNIETLAKYLLLTVAHPKRQSWKNQTVFQSLRISQKLKRTHTHTHTYTQSKNQPTKQTKTTGLQLYENVLQDTGKPFYLEKKENARARPVVSLQLGIPGLCGSLFLSRAYGGQGPEAMALAFILKI